MLFPVIRGQEAGETVHRDALEQVRERATVLVVEDEPIVRFCAAEMLLDAGFEVLEAPAADRALTILEERPDVAVLFTDIEMPGTLDGSALAAIVRHRWPAIRIVLTSGRMRPAAQTLPPLAIFLPKPYQADELVMLLAADTGRS